MRMEPMGMFLSLLCAWLIWADSKAYINGNLTNLSSEPSIVGEADSFDGCMNRLLAIIEIVRSNNEKEFGSANVRVNGPTIFVRGATSLGKMDTTHSYDCKPRDKGN